MDDVSQIVCRVWHMSNLNQMTRSPRSVSAVEAINPSSVHMYCLDGVHCLRYEYDFSTLLVRRLIIRLLSLSLHHV